MKPVKIERKTKETDIRVEFKLSGEGRAKVETGVGFFDHMLNAVTFHGGFDLDLTCKGDLEVCGHHTVEDVGIVLGQAVRKSLPKDKNIVRFASAFVPMDESLARAVVDISGRPCLVFDASFHRAKVGEFDTELVPEFFQAFVNHAHISLHLHLLHGENCHHMIEALFKAFARALRQATAIDSSRKGPTSTKGIL